MIIRENVPISELVTMRIGGNARYVFELEKEKEIAAAVEEMAARGITKWYFLGGGANTFATDAEFDGAVIVNKYSEILVEERKNDELKFIVGGGTKWDDFVNKTVEYGCTGVECLAGIPGTVGAAPVQNIGAYGQEVSTSLYDICAYDMEKKEFVHISPERCNFGYRRSIFNREHAGRYFITSIEFVLKKGEIEGELYKSLQQYLDDNNITSREPVVLAEAVRAVRNSKLPDPEIIASSGSFFKNIYVTPEEVDDLDKRGIPHHGTKVNTGWLIENSGLKGRNFYGFEISDKAALVLINKNGKSYADLQKAVKEISGIVEEKFGFKLEQEPNVIGKEDEK